MQEDQTSHRPGKVAIGISGGIAAYKVAEVLRGLQKAGCEVRVAMTKRACEFVQPLTFRALSGSHVIVDDYSPDNPDPIAHITFSQSVDLLLVAPATANIIAKFANGIADDFLTSTYLACTCPVLIAPAMNTAMWEQPATQRNILQLRNDGVHIIEPDQGEMACGTFGPGRLSEPDRIVRTALELLDASSSSQNRDLAAERFLITAGATREEIDPVRFISNRSSGRMAFAIAAAARARGARVTVIAGVTTAPEPEGVSVIRALTARAMYDAVKQEVANATVFVAAAAVADYRPQEKAPSKIKKSTNSLTLNLERTEDILQSVAGARTSDQLIIGFAAETDDLAQNARLKLVSKGLDAIVANDVSRADSGFDSHNNAILILRSDREDAIELPLMSKLRAANKILDEIVDLRRTRKNVSATNLAGNARA